MGDLTAGMDSYFFLTLGGLVFGSIALCVRYTYRSKCRSAKFCGIEIIRDIETEEREDMILNKNASPSSPSLSL